MATFKMPGKKIRLAKRGRQNRPVPLWVVLKTKRRVRRNPKRYHWKRSRQKR